MSNELPKVAVLRLHQATHANGLGNLGPVIDKNSGKFVGGLVVEKDAEGVWIRNQQHGDVFIPNGNIQMIQLAPKSK